MGWFKKPTKSIGSAMFRGTSQPRVHEFPQLQKNNFAVREIKPHKAALWTLAFDHPAFGPGEISAPRDFVAPMRPILEYDPALTDADRDGFCAAGSSVILEMPGKGRGVFREHKCFLRVLRLLIGNDGVGGIDHSAMKFWTREALDDELAHDADVDIEALFTLHAVYEPEQDRSDGRHKVYWLHSHGLAELGFVDFDVIEPSEDFINASGDPTRAIALAIVEGAIKAGGEPFPLSHPNGEVQAVDAATFDRNADQRYVRLREAEGHTDRRVVMCDAQGGFFSRLFARKIRPARWMTEPVEGRRVVIFSNAATDLMSDRARATYPRMRQIAAELSEAGIDLPMIVKLGYRVDDGDEKDREHMWFEVHSLGDGKIDATLMNQPFGIARMKPGDRAQHPVDLLTEWAIMTPFGPINPRNTTALRMIRSDPQKVYHMLQKHRKAQEGNDG
jgi:uncharacterized protein YegJ (DUF2314 family)